MKTFLLLLPRDSFFLPVLRRQLKQKNFRVVYSDYRYGDLFAKILMIIFGKKISKFYINSKLLILSVIVRPNYLLTVKGENISDILLNILGNLNITTINWFPDPMIQWKFIRKISPFYSFFFHFDPYVVRKLKKSGVNNVYYLPFAVEIFPKKEKKKYDLSFVGTFSKNREKQLITLKNFDLNIWGDYRWKQSKLKKFVRGERVSAARMHKIIKQSKINVNFHHYSTEEGTNLRTFQVTGCGSFLLTECQKDLKKLFDVGVEIYCFDNLKDVIPAVKYFLKNSSSRENIAKKGFMRTKNYHTYDQRLNEMLEVIGD